MFEKHLSQAGLTKDEALIYETLLTYGPQKASRISQKTGLLSELPLKRALVYKILEDLVRIGLVEKSHLEGQVAIFSANHPLKIKDLLEKRREEVAGASLALESVMPSIISQFNLVSGQPGVRFLEGLDGVEEILNDSLNSKTEICTYADMNSVEKYIHDINERYAKKRNQLGIDKRVIMLDDPAVVLHMKTYYPGVTHVRFIDHTLYPFTSLTEIYDKTVSFVSLTDDKKLGVLIQDESIYKMHLSLFNFIWAHAKEIKL